MYFDKFNVKKYCDKEEFSNFSINVFKNFRIIKKFNLNTEKLEKMLFMTFVYRLDFYENSVLIE